MLAFPDFTKVFQVDCDASQNAIGVVLSHEGKIVIFHSEKLNDAKKKYSFYDQELLYAIVQALKKCRYFLMPKKLVLYIDHKAL